MKDLRSEIIKLAHANPELRSQLLPLVQPVSPTQKTANYLGDAARLRSKYDEQLSKLRLQFLLGVDEEATNILQRIGATKMNYRVNDNRLARWGMYDNDGYMFSFSVAWSFEETRDRGTMVRADLQWTSGDRFKKETLHIRPTDEKQVAAESIHSEFLR